MPQVLRAENAEQAGQKFPRIIERGEQHAVPPFGGRKRLGELYRNFSGKAKDY